MKLAHDEIAGDRLIERCGHQAVGAGQIEELKVALAIHARECAFLALDGQARIVGYFLAASGQAVEQRRLATVRHAHQGDAEGRRVAGRGGHAGSTRTMTARASRRRRANTVDPMRTAIGSPPGQTSSTTCTRSPGTKPISIRRRPIAPPARSPTMPASPPPTSVTTPPAPLPSDAGRTRSR